MTATVCEKKHLSTCSKSHFDEQKYKVRKSIGIHRVFRLALQVECLGDLQGPKFRVGELAGDPIELKNGDVLEFGICKDPGQQKLMDFA